MPSWSGLVFFYLSFVCGDHFWLMIILMFLELPLFCLFFISLLSPHWESNSSMKQKNHPYNSSSMSNGQFFESHPQSTEKLVLVPPSSFLPLLIWRFYQLIVFFAGISLVLPPDPPQLPPIFAKFFLDPPSFLMTHVFSFLRSHRITF